MRVVSASSTGFPKAQWGARNKREGPELETSEKRVRGMKDELTPITSKKVIEATGDEANKPRTVVNCPPKRSLLASSPFMASEARLPQMKSLLAGYL